MAGETDSLSVDQIKKNLRQSRKTVHKVNESYKKDFGRVANKEERGSHPAFQEYKQWSTLLKQKQLDTGSVAEEEDAN